MAWIWLGPDILRLIHDEQLAEHGGISGIREEGLFLSAINRAENLENYANPDIADLAAAYGYGIAKNHPFLDGNKRTAFVAVELFLRLNNHVLIANDVDSILTMLAVAGGDMNEADFVNWVRSNINVR